LKPWCTKIGLLTLVETQTSLELQLVPTYIRFDSIFE